ncbi:GLIPR1-like protein 1 [Desmodus rotundus]|uniref:GLIPR1-like protein 1 n=1 Tax=Desmodus rotundus TaxID=9430 RepID=UPI0023811063|nr:GLIPR1-like protein 1 [Desmodus rotundus]
MVLRNELSCLWTLGFCLVASKLSLIVPSIKDESFIDECVAAHNEMRGQVQPPAADMKYMTWDEGLAKTAKAWANKCKFSHNNCLKQSYKCHPTFEFIGENIWIGGLPIFKPKFAIASWYHEKKFYNYSSLHCSKVCGHYTQIVWANSHKVGCAVTVCPKLGRAETSIFVCDYGPAGNYINTLPYKRGAPCSLCGGETCENKLCRNKERDKTQKYPNWNPQGKALHWRACNLLCLVCVLLSMF